MGDAKDSSHEIAAMKTRRTQHLLILLATVLVGNLMILVAYWKSQWLPEPAQATVSQLHHWLVGVDFSARSDTFRHDFAQRLEFEMGRRLADIQPLDLLAQGQQEKLRCNLQRLATDRLQEQRGRYFQLPAVKGDQVLKQGWDWNLRWVVYRTQLLGPNHPKGLMTSSSGDLEIYGELAPDLQSFADQVFEYGLCHEDLAEALFPEKPFRAELLQYFIVRTVEVLKEGMGRSPDSFETCLQRNLRTLLRAWCQSCAEQMHQPLSIVDQNALQAELPRLELILTCIDGQPDRRNGRWLAATWGRVFEEVGGWTSDEVAIIEFVRSRLEGPIGKREPSLDIAAEFESALQVLLSSDPVEGLPSDRGWRERDTEGQRTGVVKRPRMLDKILCSNAMSRPMEIHP